MPAYEIRGMDIPLKAGADLSEKQFFVVSLKNGDTDYVELCDDSKIPFGILQDDPKTGETGSVRIYGISKCVAGEVILSGYEVTVDSNGKGAKAGSADYVVGLAMTSAGADGERFTLRLGGVVKTVA